LVALATKSQDNNRFAHAPQLRTVAYKSHIGARPSAT
jgi:hypothetical protein